MAPNSSDSQQPAVFTGAPAETRALLVQATSGRERSAVPIKPDHHLPGFLPVLTMRDVIPANYHKSARTNDGGK
jgi:hypothetical protein